MLRSFGLEPGAEFRAGIEEADRIGVPPPPPHPSRHFKTSKLRSLKASEDSESCSFGGLWESITAPSAWQNKVYGEG